MEVKMGHKILYYLEEVDKLVAGNKYQPPVTCEIDPSNKCQNNCNFCIYADYLKSDRCDLPFDMYHHLLFDLKTINVKSITFTGGGEPLMSQYFNNMAELAFASEFEIGLVTNGIKLDTEAMEGITHMFKFIRVSLDAASSETYTRIKGSKFFDRVCRNIKNLSKLGCTDVGVSFVVTDHNRHEIEDFERLGLSLGADYVQVKPAWKPCDIEKTMDSVSDKDAFLTERYTVEQNSMVACHIAGLVGQVAANGKVYYCCVQRGKKEFEIGDLCKETFSNIMLDRPDFEPDISHCGSCRYMNYAKVYEKVTDKKYLILRHKRFI